MKKILSISLLLSSALFASHEEGIRYGIGGRAGIAAFTGKICSQLKFNMDANPIPTTTIYQIAQTTKPGTISFQGGAFAEIAYRTCNWSFGALVDINGDTLNANESITTTAQTTTNTHPINAQTLNQACIKTPLHIGGDIRAGKYFGDILWYGLIGGEGIRIRYNHYFSDQRPLGAAQNPPQTTFNPVTFGVPCANRNNSCANACNTTNNCNYFWQGALRIGTGIEYNWTDCLNVKLEYRLLLTGKKQFNFASPVTPGFAQFVAVNAQELAVDTLYFRQSITALMLSYQF